MLPEIVEELPFLYTTIFKQHEVVDIIPDVACTRGNRNARPAIAHAVSAAAVAVVEVAIIALLRQPQVTITAYRVVTTRLGALRRSTPRVGRFT
jgi:hypothetical protein